MLKDDHMKRLSLQSRRAASSVSAGKRKWLAGVLPQMTAFQ